MIQYEVFIYYPDEPYYCVKMFDCLDTALDYMYNKSRCLFFDDDSVDFYLFKVSDSKRRCMLYHIKSSGIDYE